MGVSVGGVWISHDGGKSWNLGGKGFEAAYMPPDQQGDLVMQDPHLIAASPTDPDRIWCQHHCGIYVSDDGGYTFRESRGVHPSSFGFAVAPHPSNRDRAWFAPAQKDEARVPVNGKFVVTETRDGGQTFVSHRRGLPVGPSYDLVYRHALVVDPSGDRLAMGSTTGKPLGLRQWRRGLAPSLGPSTPHRCPDPLAQFPPSGLRIPIFRP